MNTLLAARSQMALSLAFHIIFATIGMAMPFFMATAHWLALRRQDEAYLALTRAWSRGVAIFFAIGAVSGTALALELGLLWPGFMVHAGAIIGMPFSWEGTVFFLEAVALGLFLYGWDRLPPWIHWGTGLAVGISGLASAAAVICANAWMNAPTGFDWVGDHAEHIDPVAAMFNGRAFDQGLHMILAGFVATGFAVAGVHAAELLRRPGHPLHQRALKIALTFASVAAILQPLSGDLTARTVAEKQPLKLAAAEALFHSGECAPMLLGGAPDVAARVSHFGFEVPCVLSFLAFGDPHARVQGLDAFPPDLWPPVPIVHFAYQLMVGCGTFLAALGVAALTMRFRRPAWLLDRRALLLFAAVTPLGYLCLECGWTVTEVGRQPWIIYGILKTKDAVTPMPGLTYSFSLYAALYGALSLLAAWLLLRQVRHLRAWKAGGDDAHD